MHLLSNANFEYYLFDQKQIPVEWPDSMAG